MNYFTYKTNFMDKGKKTKHITQRKEKSEKVMPLCCPVSWSSGLCSLQGIHFRQHFSSWNTSCVMEPYVISSVHKVNATELTLMTDNMNKHLCFIICINPAQTKTVFSIQYLNSSCPKLHALYSENCPCCTDSSLLPRLSLLKSLQPSIAKLQPWKLSHHVSMVAAGP